MVSHLCAPLTLIHTTVAAHFYTELTTDQFIVWFPHMTPQSPFTSV